MPNGRAPYSSLNTLGVAASMKWTINIPGGDQARNMSTRFMEPPINIAFWKITLHPPSIFQQDHLMSLAVICLIATRSTTDGKDVIVSEWLADKVESGLVEQVIGDGDPK
jgi:hypothetical protein